MNEAELIINSDGSIYHLALRPEDIADTIFLVGDQDRVPEVSKYFDRIDVKKQKREFITHTGWIGQKRLSVISTGIGTDNIEIVMNELDALVNIDLMTRQINPNFRSLSLIRIGTSGAIHPDVKMNDTVVSKYAIGIDSLGYFYDVQRINFPSLPPWSYLTTAYDFELGHFDSDLIYGITLTCPGFYNPQGRVLRIPSVNSLPIEQLISFQIKGIHITNIEMESSGMYLLASLLGHKAISFNAILAHRLNGEFTRDPRKVVDGLIQKVLKWVTHFS